MDPGDRNDMTTAREDTLSNGAKYSASVDFLAQPIAFVIMMPKMQMVTIRRVILWLRLLQM